MTAGDRQGEPRDRPQIAARLRPAVALYDVPALERIYAALPAALGPVMPASQGR